MADLAKWIRQLSASDPESRERDASALYYEGVTLGESAVSTWRVDAQCKEMLGAATVGIAVQPTQFAQIRAANGTPPLANVPPDQDAMEFELHFGLNVHLDILTTKAPGGGGAIDKFLQKFGEGIQQIEYLVPDVDRATELLRARFGIKPIYPQTRAGADGTRVNFFLVRTPDGKTVLIELVEAKSGSKEVRK